MTEIASEAVAGTLLTLPSMYMTPLEVGA